MTSAEMLSSLRTKLDEASASMWTDAECYRALSDAQLEIIAILPIDLVAKNVTTTSLSSGSIISGKYIIAKPTDLLKLISTNFNDVPARIIRDDKERRKLELNTYMVASATDPLVYEKGEYLEYSPSDGSDTVEITYLPIPTDIDASTSSSLIGTSHPAIVQYAYAELLKKQDRLQEAANEFGLFIQMLGMIK